MRAILFNNRQFLHKGNDMDCNQYYEDEKDGHGRRPGSMKFAIEDGTYFLDRLHQHLFIGED
jgi:hypothetical protein